MKYVIPGALFLTAAVTGGLALVGPDMGQGPWLVSRAAGLASYTLLSASVVLGLLMSTKKAGSLMSKPFVFAMHQFISILTLVLIGLHGGALLFDGFIHFTPVSLLVPFLSPYRPLWVGVGVISGWSAAIVTASFWFRKHIGYKAWRKLHFLSFASWGMALLHGVNAGTDTSLPAVQFLFWGSAVLICGLLAYRILVRPSKSQSRRETPAAIPTARRTAA